jgi:hypothetical protein
MRKQFLWLAITILTLTGCGLSCELPEEVALNKEEVIIERLEYDLFACNTIEDVLVFLNGHKVLKSEFLGSAQYPNDTVLAQNLLRRIKNPYIDSLLQDVEKEFGDMNDLKTEFENTFARIRTYDPGFPNPRIQTLVTGFGSAEMIVSDTLIIIGLDFYAGPDASFRPNDFPDYILERFQKEYIIPASVLILSNAYISSDYTDFTMLADMIYYGKKYQFTKEMMPCTKDSLIIWYSEKQLRDINDNKQLIWANFLQNELLYETNHINKEKFLGERPNTYEISAICPGRIGAWVGWEILKEYMKRYPDVPLQQIMEEPDAQKIFNNSKYRG